MKFALFIRRLHFRSSINFDPYYHCLDYTLSSYKFTFFERWYDNDKNSWGSRYLDICYSPLFIYLFILEYSFSSCSNTNSTPLHLFTNLAIGFSNKLSRIPVPKQQEKPKFKVRRTLDLINSILIFLNV